MKYFYSELEFHSIDKLIICSLELALYQAFVVIDGEEHAVWESGKKILRTRNLIEMREKFAPFNIGTTVLRHDSPYDEMVGQPVSSGNRMEVPLGVNPYAVPKWLNS